MFDVNKLGSVNSEEPVSEKTKSILKNGELLETTEKLAFRGANNYDFARRISQEISLIFAGQAIKHLDIGKKDRAYSHAGIFAPAGMGKDFAYDLMVDSGIFPKDLFRIARLDKITEAALEGTIVDNKLVPPPTVTKDIISTTEWASMSSGPNAGSLLADLRVMWEKGEYTRGLAKIGKLDQVLETGDVETAEYVRKQMAKFQKMGMYLDTDECQIKVKTTSSWIIASADFGSQTKYGKSLLSLGDLNRIRWRAYLPTREERLRVISDVGSLPPVKIDTGEKRACCEAWRITIEALKKLCAEGIEIPRDTQSYYERKRILGETIKEMMDRYPQLEKGAYFNQLTTLRNVSEFRRLMYQHAALKQFARDSGNDLSCPKEFLIDYKEDGEFAKELWLEEYVPSMIDIINNVLSHPSKAAKRVTKTRLGQELVLKRLSESTSKREELLELAEKNGISRYTVDNQILRRLLESGFVARDSHGWYSLTEKGKQEGIEGGASNSF